MLRRTRLYVILALTLGLGVLFFTRQEAWAEDEAPVKRVAILELKNLAPAQLSPAEVSFLSDEVRRITSLLPKERYLIMTKENIELMLPPDVKLEDCQGSCEVETGRLLQADYLITGELIKFGSSLRVSLKAHDTRSGTFLKGETAKGKSVEELEEPIQLATLGLMLEISSSFKAELSVRAGLELKDQLACLKQATQCRAPQAPSLSAAPPSARSRTSTARGPESSEAALSKEMPPVTSTPSSNHLGLGLGTFVASYLVTVIGVRATDPWPGQREASLIPVLGPIQVEMINSEHGDNSFLAVNILLSAAQGFGLGLALYDLLGPSPLKSGASELSFGLSPDGQGVTLSGRF